MFGYVRAFKPYLRVCEYDTYQAIYCGLCKQMAKQTGQVSRYTLSYDMTFLAVMNMSVNDIPVKAKRERCPIHPIKKQLCVYENIGLEYPTDAAALLIHYKLTDGICDGDIIERGASRTALSLLKNGYRGAKKRYPALDKQIALQMKRQMKLERDKEASLDIACDPTAKMLEAVFELLSYDERKRALLKKFGYQLGRFIYITDALDDAGKDKQDGNYNPLLLAKGVSKSRKPLTVNEYKIITEYAENAVRLTLGELAEQFMELDLKMYRATLDNIIYVGLPNVFEMVKKGKFDKEKRCKEKENE